MFRVLKVWEGEDSNRELPLSPENHVNSRSGYGSPPRMRQAQGGRAWWPLSPRDE
jgi:hypothetical protein